MPHELTRLHDGGNFFEGARWHDGKWWVSDFFGGAVTSVTPAGEATIELEVPTWPSGLGWLPDGSLLVVSMTDRTVLRRWPDGSVSVHADISAFSEGVANDMAVTTDGHAYIGNMGYEWVERHPHDATLVHVDPDGHAELATRDVNFPNGPVILSDGVTLVVGDTFAAEYVAWTIQPDGTLADRRVWATLGTPVELDADGRIVALPSVAPDGCAADADDRIWMTDAAGARAALVAEGGEILDEIEAPDGLSFFACAIGGPAGTTLLLCAAPDYDPEARSAVKEAVLYTVELGESATSSSEDDS